MLAPSLGGESYADPCTRTVRLSARLRIRSGWRTSSSGDDEIPRLVEVVGEYGAKRAPLLRSTLASRSEGVDFAFIGAILGGGGGEVVVIVGMGDDIEEDRECCRDGGEPG